MSRATRSRHAYVLSEQDEMRARILSSAMRGIGRLVEGDENNRHTQELPAEELAAIFYSLADSNDRIMDRAIYQRMPGREQG